MVESHSIEATPEDEAHVITWLEQVVRTQEITYGTLMALCAEIGEDDEMASIGRVALKHGILEVAAEMFKRLEWDDALGITGLQALDAGKYREAYAIFSRLEDTEHLRALVPLAIQARDFGSAYVALKQVGDKIGLQKLGAKCLEERDYSMAQSAYEAGGETQNIVDIGMRAVESGDFKIGLGILWKALTRLELARAEDAHVEEAYQGLIQTFTQVGLAAMKKKNLPAALQAFEAVKDKTHALEVGNIAVQIKDYKLAVKAFSIAENEAATRSAKEKLAERTQQKN